MSTPIEKNRGKAVLIIIIVPAWSWVRLPVRPFRQYSLDRIGAWLVGFSFGREEFTNDSDHPGGRHELRRNCPIDKKEESQSHAAIGKNPPNNRMHPTATLRSAVGGPAMPMMTFSPAWFRGDPARGR
jgi:hypothetical protein